MAITTATLPPPQKRHTAHVLQIIPDKKLIYPGSVKTRKSTRMRLALAINTVTIHIYKATGTKNYSDIHSNTNTHIYQT